MKVKEILQHKGDDVATIAPSETIAVAVSSLATRGVGALVVSADGAAIEGIVSERDVVRALDARGAAVLDEAVTVVMTPDVLTCELTDRIEQLMAVMTEHRIRHLPVVDEGGTMVGIISIGDVVKNRLDELESETRHMSDYISGR